MVKNYKTVHGFMKNMNDLQKAHGVLKQFCNQRSLLMPVQVYQLLLKLFGKQHLLTKNKLIILKHKKHTKKKQKNQYKPD